MFPFLQLPTEIRLSIYKLVLPYSEYGVDVQPTFCNPVTWTPGNASILFVNRQVYQEAVEILYRDNFFAIYVRHPRQPRLPFYDSQADAESFVLISWSGRSPENPKNPRLLYSLLMQHSNLRNIRHVHISLPSFDDLLGVDVYMQKTSYAAFSGIKAWVDRCSKAGGRIDEKDRERMDYVQQIKGPIDEVGLLLRTLPRIDELYISLYMRQRQVAFAEYMLRQLFALQNVNNVSAYYASGYGTDTDPIFLARSNDGLLEVAKTKVEDVADYKEQSHLPSDMDDMFWLLQSIRAKQQRDPARIPDWTHAMPE